MALDLWILIDIVFCVNSGYKELWRNYIFSIVKLQVGITSVWSMCAYCTHFYLTQCQLEFSTNLREVFKSIFYTLSHMADEGTSFDTTKKCLIEIMILDARSHWFQDIWCRFKGVLPSVCLASSHDYSREEYPIRSKLNNIKKTITLTFWYLSHKN